MGKQKGDAHAAFAFAPVCMAICRILILHICPFGHLQRKPISMKLNFLLSNQLSGILKRTQRESGVDLFIGQWQVELLFL